MKANKLYGLHSVKSVLDYSPEQITKAWLDGQRQDARLQAVVTALQALGIEPIKTDRKKLDSYADGNNHQGIVVEVLLPELLTEADLKDKLAVLEKPALFLVLDQVQDPHNLGACLRSCDAAGVDGVIIPKDNAVAMTPTVCKVASGAAETVPVYQVTNLARCLRLLKQQGLWLIGAAGEAEQTLYQVDFTVPVALVIGAEDKGMRRLTRENCDVLVKLPMFGQVESLNLSVAAGVFLYEAVRQRLA
ncbi:23S rRNA (guanosine(2251)-2'-O)-methyltransferase RlmB [Methylocucumis oryzae]|uniref:23S rRNA (guanosine-2'-O-)-methyltransferase RlmB n=1 Tax=Methylocucumis oryzae TaxID=1632867 RepID=A0A0F3IIG3_9GAMM|nr:23S rRNA (guanosine(2251)-2'-O)-methyltransferase RlmB [Methylocucumis oryzae]KJV06462.1 23S rRNA methyltransferase [Methylocucumis oryzae]